MNTCSNCRDATCPDQGRDQVACESWTNDGNGKANEPDPFAALEARIHALEGELQEVKTTSEEAIAQFRRVLAAINVASQPDVD